MNLRAAFAALLALILAACQETPPSSDGGVSARPMLFQVSKGSDEPRAWLFGTIHALPDGVEWRTAALEQSIDAADMLMVEIAGLENESRMRAIFAQLATTPGQPDIGLKVPATYRPRLFAMINESGLAPSDLAATETWAAALLLAQLGNSGDAANGADRAMIREFAGREIFEFEGVEAQLGIFDQLPESEQRDLLVAVVDDLEQHRADPGKLRRAWLNGDEQAIEEAMQSGMLADPELRQALLVNRNAAWLSELLPRLERNQRPLIAVGAAHLVGTDGLVAMLEKQGYTVTRIQ